jgi:hypothetical protein
VLWDGISSVPDETVILLWLGCRYLVLWEEGIPREGEDDCWVGEATVLHVTSPCTRTVTIVHAQIL